MVGNSITQGLFNSNLVDFFTGRLDGQYKAGSDGSYRLTLPEILGFSGAHGFGGTYAKGYGFQRVVTDNAKKNAGNMIATAILAPMVANIATKMLRKPVIRPANKMLKMTGLDVKLA